MVMTLMMMVMMRMTSMIVVVVMMVMMKMTLIIVVVVDISYHAVPVILSKISTRVFFFRQMTHVRHLPIQR